MQLFIIVILVVSLVSALIGITTNYWYESLSNEFNEGLWVICHRQSSTSYSSSNGEICNKQPYFKSQGLAISGIVVLSIALILSIIRRYRKNDSLLGYITILILVGSTLLLMFSYLLFPREIHFRQLGYSIYFMVFSSLSSLITTGLVVFTTRTTQST
jgi:MFS family permease